MNLSKNFALAELIEAGSARRLGLEDQFNPPDQIIINLTNLCCNVLQPLREVVGHSIRINSGYRSQKVNKAVGGAKNSDHLYGYAADISLYRNGKNCNQELYDTILKLKLPFRQMIDEFGSESEPAWIHISYREGDNKKECLRARKVNGKTKYTLL